MKNNQYIFFSFNIAPLRKWLQKAPPPPLHRQFRDVQILSAAWEVYVVELCIHFKNN